MLLGAVLLTAIVRPRRVPEAAVAVPAALIVIVTGALPLHQAGDTARRLLPVLGFLGAVLVLGHFCQQEGLFTAAGARLARASRGYPVRLLRGVFGLASVTTAVLSLDTTVVLLTPVVHDTAARLRVRPKPPVYACTHLANSASLLLPVSNLTNLLAFAVAGLTLVLLRALMALPWLAAIAVEYLMFRWFFAADLAVGGQPVDGPVPRIPAFRAAHGDRHAGRLRGHLVRWPEPGLGGVRRRLPAGRAGPGPRHGDERARLARATGIPFLLFVLSLGLVVAAVVRSGLGSAIAQLVPAGTALPALLAIAGLAAVLANLVNNLPAILVLLSVLAPAGPGPVLAALIGVNIGPNLSYAGSLATLLWRRLLADRDHDVELAELAPLAAWCQSPPGGCGHRGAMGRAADLTARGRTPPRPGRPCRAAGISAAARSASKPPAGRTHRARSLPTATHSVTWPAPARLACSVTAPTSRSASPPPRAAGLTHIDTRCQAWPGPGRGGRAAISPAGWPCWKPRNQGRAPIRARHSASGWPSSPASVAAKASGASASAASRTSRTVAQSSGCARQTRFIRRRRSCGAASRRSVTRPARPRSGPRTTPRRGPPEPASRIAFCATRRASTALFISSSTVVVMP